MTKFIFGKQEFADFDEYSEYLSNLEKERGPFRDYLLKLKDEFEAWLSVTLSPQSVNELTNVIQIFIHFLYWKTDVTSFDKISVGMAKSQFQKYWNSRVLNDPKSKNELEMAIREFFWFMKIKKNLENPKISKNMGF